MRRLDAKTALGAAALLALLAVSPLQALDPVNTNRKRVAIRGYDAVAYFTQGRPVPGSSEITFRWQGAAWWFASADNRDTFAADPERHAPQYGGYCAKAVSEGTTADIDPQAWKIVDGKLYLNYSRRIQRVWEQDIPGRIARGDEHWPKLLGR